MGVKNQYPKDFPAGLIQKKARELILKPYFWGDDQKDIEQELCIATFKARSKFDPSRGSYWGYWEVVVNNAAASLIVAQMSKERTLIRLAVRLEDEGDCEGKGTRPIEPRVDQEEYFHLTGKGAFDPARDLDRSIDIKKAEATLPPDLQDLCQRLRVSRISEIARDLNVSRQWIYRQVAIIRELFQENGIDRSYLVTGQNHESSGRK